MPPTVSCTLARVLARTLPPAWRNLPWLAQPLLSAVVIGVFSCRCLGDPGRAGAGSIIFTVVSEKAGSGERFVSMPGAVQPGKGSDPEANALLEARVRAEIAAARGPIPIPAAGGDWDWLKERLLSAGSGPSAHLYPEGQHTWTARVKATMSAVTGIRLVITSWAVPPGDPITLDLGVDVPAAAQLALANDEAQGLSANPTSFTAHWRASTIELHPRDNRSTTGQRDVVPELAEAVRRMLAAACAAAARNAAEGAGFSAIRKAAETEARRLLAPEDRLDVSIRVDASRIILTSDGPDPILNIQVTAVQMLLPQKLGGVQDVVTFDRKYGAFAFATALREDRTEKTCELMTQTQQRFGGLEDGFPRFISADDRDAARRAILSDDQVFFAKTSISSAGALQFDYGYQPTESVARADISGGGARSYSGSAGFSRTWANGKALSLDTSVGTDDTSVSASFSHATHDLRGGLVFQLGYDASYLHELNVRLGTRSGPLVRRQDTVVGARPRLSWFSADKEHDRGQRSWHRRWFLTGSLFGGYRWLRGFGDPALLGSPNVRFDGWQSGASVSVAYADEAAPPEKPFARRQAVAYRAGLSAESTFFDPRPSPAYWRHHVETHVHAAFGRAAATELYLEGRGGFARATAATPRLDFGILGGESVLLGLEPGELAGREVANFAAEGGVSFATIIDAFPKPVDPARETEPHTEEQKRDAQLLKSAFLVALAEYGHVSGHAGAGSNWNPHRSAESYSVGCRLIGALPGPTKDSSVFIGYGWSPESLRRSGRFVAQVLIYFPQ